MTWSIGRLQTKCQIRPDAIDSGQIKASLGTYLNFYNTRRPHQSLDGQTPDTIYFAGLPQNRVAA